MSKLLGLAARFDETSARVAALTASHAELKSSNLALTAKVAELVAQDIADDAQVAALMELNAKLMAMIDGELDAGGSTGGVVG